jgi:hypothetical protein
MRIKTNQHGQISYLENGKHLVSGDRRFCLFWSERLTVGHSVVQEGSELYDLIMGDRAATMILPCHLIPGGKFRGGAARQWCKTHQCAFGTKVDLASGKCSSADMEVSVLRSPPVFNADSTIWLAFKPAIFLGDRRRKFNEGIRVHSFNGTKKIDAAFPAAILNAKEGFFAITPTIARSRFLALTCNSLTALPTAPQTNPAQPATRVNASEFSAIAIWASTPALYSTREQVQAGIHVHAWRGKEKAIDDTFSEVALNGEYLDRNDLLAKMLGKNEWSRSLISRQEIVH